LNLLTNPMLGAMLVLLLIGVGAFAVGLVLMRFLRDKLTK
jgi:uncharacterized membrane protein HdeD (DUF308 family)